MTSGGGSTVGMGSNEALPGGGAGGVVLGGRSMVLGGVSRKGASDTSGLP